MSAYYIGTDLKFKIDIQAVGFDMDVNDYSIVLKCGNQRVAVSKSNVVTDGGDHYLLIDTTQFASGVLTLIVTANVTDSDFPGGVRREVDVKKLCIINNT